jgi:non-ribosomal peptide synthetase component F
VAAALRRLGGGEQATLFMTLLAVFQAVLHWHSRQTDLVIGTDIAGRTRRESEEVIGFFSNQLALRADLSGNPSLRQMVARSRDVARGAYAHQDVPFDKVVEALRPDRRVAQGSPLFQVKLNFQARPAAPPALPGIALRPLEVERDTAQLDLLLTVREAAEGLGAGLQFSSDVFDRDTAGRLLDGFVAIAELAAANPAATLAEAGEHLAARHRRRTVAALRGRPARRSPFAPPAADSADGEGRRSGDGDGEVAG